MKETVAISTFGGIKEGFGHIRRSLWLAEIFQKEYGLEPLLLINSHPRLLHFLKDYPFAFRTISSSEEEKKILLNLSDCRLLIVDKRDTDLGFYHSLPFLTLGIDNYGTDAQRFDFLVNPLPHYRENPANFKGTSYMILPPEFWRNKQPRLIRSIRKILVSFGGSDPTDLSFLFKEVLERISQPLETQIVLGLFYQGKLKNPLPLPPHIQILPPQENLYELMRNSDLVVTSFGLTAYEAAILGVPVFVLNHSSYHEKLSQKVGFPGAGVGKDQPVEIIREKLLEFLKAPFGVNVEKPAEGNLNFKILLKNLLEKQKRFCPVCGESEIRILKREGWNNLYFCERDKMYFRNPEYSATTSYSSNYFLEDYKKQYGKTYEEDRPNIDRLNKSRLEILRSLLPKRERKHNLLEVGCALGFFLDMARETGEFETAGLEISSYAAGYARQKLNLEVWPQDFLKTEFKYPYYDVLAMWYYIEHNRKLEKVIEQIRNALKIGGILALSTPNAHGVSSRKNAPDYASRIPEDHYYEFSPQALTRFLESWGFECIHIRTTGIHPKRWVKQPFRWADRLLAWIMKKRKMGDTFEAYFRRVR